MVLQALGDLTAMLLHNPYLNHNRKTPAIAGRLLRIQTHDQMPSLTSPPLLSLASPEVRHNHTPQDRQRVNGRQVHHLANRHNRKIQG